MLEDMLQPGHEGDNRALGIMSRVVLFCICAIVLALGSDYGRGG